jgi:hypothetical protein
VVITSEIPPPASLMDEIDYAISITKSAGIDIGIIYPTIKKQNITVQITDITGAILPKDNIDKAVNAIINYCNNLSVGDILIISQLERAIGNAIDNVDIDVVVQVPAVNVVPSSTEVIRCGIITINGQSQT